jgi:hypothetical protein
MDCIRIIQIDRLVETSINLNGDNIAEEFLFNHSQADVKEIGALWLGSAV